MPASAKYFRTYHVPWTECLTSDDKILPDVDHFVGQMCVITEKLDGENQTWTRDSVYARSHGGPPVHPSNDLSKALWAERRWDIDKGLSVFFEYTFAMHSIYYSRMAKERAYVHIIGVRDDATGVHWAWQDVVLMAHHLGFPTVPIIFGGLIETEEQLRLRMPCGGPSHWGDHREGEVVRLATHFSDPNISIAKAVRRGHVQSDKHWKRNWKPMHEVVQ